MLSALTSKLGSILNSTKSSSHLAGERLDNALAELQILLVEADVALSVATGFIANIRRQMQSLPQGQATGHAFKDVIREQLLDSLGRDTSQLPLVQNAKPAQIILMVGVQGAGKTTSAAKLALHLKNKHRLKPAVASLDLRRDAAQQQLETLADEVGVPFLPVKGKNLAKAGREHLRRAMAMNCDTLILDTAGRGAVDQELLDELTAIAKALNITETLLVIDSMTGQTALKLVQSFSSAVQITGLILTKLDSDTRGGALLSARSVTQVPVRFIGVSEQIDGLELFSPQRFAGRLLGDGDLEGLAESLETIDKDKAQKVAKRMMQGQLSMTDLKMQFQQVQKMGGLQSVASKLPGLSNIAQNMPAGLDSAFIVRSIALIDSMTEQERQAPSLLKMQSRKKRILKGAGCKPVDFSRLVNQHSKMSRMMKKVNTKGGMGALAANMMGQDGMNPGQLMNFLKK